MDKPNKHDLQDQIFRGFLLNEETSHLLECVAERFSTEDQRSQAMEDFSQAFAEVAIASTQKYIDRFKTCDMTPENFSTSLQG